MATVRPCALPADALLHTYVQSGAYTDCCRTAASLPHRVAWARTPTDSWRSRCQFWFAVSLILPTIVVTDARATSIDHGGRQCRKNAVTRCRADRAPFSRDVRQRMAARRRRSRTASAPKPRAAGGAHALTSFEDVREVAHALPGVEDGTSYGTPALKVGGKLFARLHQNRDCLVLRTDLLDREILMQSAPEVFFITDHYRNYPWILVRFATVEKRALPDLIERAWRLVAPKTMVKKYDDAK